MLGSDIVGQVAGRRRQTYRFVKVITAVLVILMLLSCVTVAEELHDETDDSKSGAAISIRSPVEIGKSVISLGDLATFSGLSEDAVENLSRIEVGKAPSPGETRTLSLAIVKIRLRQAGYDPDSISIKGPVTIVVSTRSAAVTGDEIARAVEEYVRANMPWNPEEVRISVFQGHDMIPVPDGEIRIAVEPLSTTRFTGTSTVKALILADGMVTKTFNVRVRLDVAKEVVVAGRTIKRHEIISPSDLTLAVRDLSGVPYDVAFDPLLVAGMRAKHTIQAGRPVALSDIQCPPVVFPGDLVALEAVSGGVTVIIPGEALEAGASGELIRVRNTSSGAIVKARVIDSQRVQGI